MTAGAFDLPGRKRVIEATRRDERRARYAEKPGYDTPPRSRASRDAGGDANPVDYFWAILGTATLLDGAMRRWAYAWAEAQRSSTGWAAKEGGRASTDETLALNGIENPNDDSGVQGNGVDVANLVGTFDVVPLGAGAVVMMWRDVLIDGDTEVEYYSFSAVNQVDGACT